MGKLIFYVSLFVIAAIAGERSERGYFFGEEPPKPIVEQNKTVPRIPESKPKEEKKITEKEKEWEFPIRPDAPEWAKPLLKNPTRENAEAYLTDQYKYVKHLEKIGFAIREAYLAKGSEIYPVQGYPDSQISALNFHSEDKNTIYKKALGYAKDKLGLIFFFSGKCSACKQQAPIVSYLNTLYGLEVRAVSVDGSKSAEVSFKQTVNPELAKSYGIKEIPTLVAVYDAGNKDVKTAVISNGYTPLDQIESMLVKFLVLNGAIPERMFNQKFGERE